MFKKIVVGLLVISLLFFCVVALQPADFRIARSARIAVPPGAVFAQVNDFHKWDAWSPWAKLDPNSTSKYEGPDAGEGAVFHWSGNDEVGEGKMTLVESKPDELIRIKLDFVKPMQSTSDVRFTFKPEGDQTEVTWEMTGTNGFIEKAFCLFMDMDKLVGGKFEEGLASLKGVAEGSTPKEATPGAPPESQGAEPPPKDSK